VLPVTVPAATMPTARPSAKLRSPDDAADKKNALDTTNARPSVPIAPCRAMVIDVARPGGTGTPSTRAAPSSSVQASP
jgi:hypothetical protein